jgi:GNAT superfamily N-acetyltransferase
MDGRLIIRPARPEDRPAVERICAHTWEWGDYIPEVWDDWLADEQAVLQVGEIDGQVVAVNRLVFHSPVQAWFEGMRVDPERRRQGIGWQFMEHDLAYARERGAQVVRLATGHANTAVHNMVARIGMVRIGAGQLLAAEAMPGGPLPAILGPEHASQVTAFLRRSSVLGHMHGLYDAGWVWQTLSAERVTEMLATGQMAALLAPEEELAALAVILINPEGGGMWVGYADADASRPEAVTALATGLRAYAARLGNPQIEAMLPDLAWLRDAFRAAGYYQGDWKGELWIFERRLDEDGADLEALSGDGQDG